MSIDAVMNYVECDLDASVTLPEWRRMRVATRRRRRPVARLVGARLRTAIGA
jgi:hypothetical protein